MNLEYAYNSLHDDFKAIIRTSIATDAVKLLFSQVKKLHEEEMQSLNTDISAEQFKYKYMIARNTIDTYEEIIELITKLQLQQESGNEDIQQIL